MDLDDLFANEIAAMAEDTDDFAVRRLTAQALREYHDLLTDPVRLAQVDDDIDRFDAADAAFRRAAEAESLGDHVAAAAEYRTAAEFSIGDSTLRLAHCLVLLGEHRAALQWCAEAEAEGFDEAADLAARCYAALGEAAPARPGAEVPLAVEPRQERASGPRRPADMSADPGLTRRLKALACTAPLHDLDARKAMLDWLRPDDYQMSEIALRIIDLITIAMDFDQGGGHDDVIGRVVPFVTSQAPHRPFPEHERVARWVLERLINVGTVDRTFQQVYGVIDLDGDYHRLPFNFKIVEEVPGPRGSLALRTSDEAITVLIGALDTDVESAQIAAEVKLKNLIERGKLADARSAAEQARYRTVQYGESLRRRLEATRRDVLLVDWERELPDMLNDALTHVEGRVSAEQEIQAKIAEHRDAAGEPERKRHAAELVAVVEDCLRRHVQLQARLQSARSVFRAEQDRQQFSGPPRRSAVNLHGQLLEPVLGLPVRTAVGPVSTFFRVAVGTTAPEVVTLSGLVSTLLRPTVEPARTAGPVVHPVIQALDDDARFTPEHWRLADLLLDLPGRVRTLAELVEEAAEHDDELPVLVALRANNALTPAIDTARGKKFSHVLMAVPAGTTFTGPRGTASGDDLLVTAAELREPEAAEPSVIRDGIDPEVSEEVA